MDTWSKVKQKPHDGCVCALTFSAEKGLKACSRTRRYNLQDTFDSLSASLMGMRCKSYLYVFAADEAILVRELELGP